MLGQLARASAQGNPQQALAFTGNLPASPKLTGVSLDDLEAKVAGQSHATVTYHMLHTTCYIPDGHELLRSCQAAQA